MRKVVVSALAAAAVLAAVPLADAAGPPKKMITTGTIKTVDMIRHTVTLDNGATFKMERGVNIRYMKAGQKVTLTYTGSGPTIEASAITPVVD